MAAAAGGYTNTLFKWTGGLITAALTTAIGTYVTARLAPGTPVGNAAARLLPDDVAATLPKGGPELHPSGGSISPLPEPLPAPSSAAMDPVRLAGAVSMTVTPLSAPLAVAIAPPVLVGQSLHTTLFVQAKSDALKVFVPEEGGPLLDWSARLIQSGVTCRIDNGQIGGIRTLQDSQWDKPGTTYDQLPVGTPTPVDVTLFCNGEVEVGQTLLLTSRFDAVPNNDRITVRFSSPPLSVVKHR